MPTSWNIAISCTIRLRRFQPNTRLQKIEKLKLLKKQKTSKHQNVSLWVSRVSFVERVDYDYDCTTVGFDVEKMNRLHYTEQNAKQGEHIESFNLFGVRDNLLRRVIFPCE
jgi:hypothetical protein